MFGEIMGAAPLARFDVTAKRVLDVVVAGTLLVVLLPLIVAVSLAIKAGSRGPRSCKS
jgi:lipopolysaccharide/colanic/teichoic acid biosynthesis glycosyltransferase